MPARVCRVCGVPFIGVGLRCSAHRRSAPSRAQDQVYADPLYRRVRKSILTAWVRDRGYWCPGAPDLAHGPHPSTDLTIDHLTPISQGGHLTDRRNLRVLCRSANDRKRHQRQQGVT